MVTSPTRPVPVPWQAAAPVLVAGAIKQRNSAVVVLLMLVTCGIYAFYWLYKTSNELRLALRDESINPTVDLLLTIVTCGVFGLYVEYRNVQKVHVALFAREPTRGDQSQLVLLLNGIALLVAVTGFAASYIAQEEYNALGRAANTVPGPEHAPA